MVLQDAGTLYPSLEATVLALNEIFLELSSQSAYFIKTMRVTVKEVDDINSETRIYGQETRDRETSVLFQGEDPVYCKRPLSSYPQHILTYREISCYDRDKDCAHPSFPYLLSRSCTKAIGIESRVRLTFLLYSFYTALESYRDRAGCNIESVIKFKLHKLVVNDPATTGSAVRRGIKRSWKIEHSAASSWKQVGTEHLASCTELPRRFKGVRCRPGRAKSPWIAEIKLPKEKKKTHIGCFGTREEAARAYDVAAIYAGKDTPLNFEDSREFVPPQGFEKFIRKGQVDRDDVSTQNTISATSQGSWTAHSLRPKESRLCFEQGIASQENAPRAFIGGVEEIDETTTSLLLNAPPAKSSEISSTFHTNPLQEMTFASLSTTSRGLGAANMPLPNYQFSQIDETTTSLPPNAPPAGSSEISSTFHTSPLQEMTYASLPTTSRGLGAANMPLPNYQFSQIDETTTSLPPNAPPTRSSEISSTFHTSPLQVMTSASLPTTSRGLGAANMPLPNYQFSQVLMNTGEIDHNRLEWASETPKVDPGMVDLDDWTERLVELMDGSDQVERSAPSVSDPLNFPFEVPSDSLITQSDPNTIPGFHPDMIDIPSIDQATIAISTSSGTPLHWECPPGQGSIVCTPSSSGGGSSYPELEENNESEFSFRTAFQALINLGDSSRNMVLLLQLVRQHFDKHGVEVVLRPK